MKNKRLKNKIEYYSMTTAIKLFRFFPYSWTQKLLSSLFVNVGTLFNIRRDVAREQLQQSFPDESPKEIKAILRDTYRHYASVAADLFISETDENKTIDVNGWENITDAIGLGRGLLFISGHFGNWELAGRHLAANNIPINVVIKRLHNPFVNEYINNLRTKHGIKIIYKKRALKPTLTAFKNNEALVTLIDQDAGKDGIRHPFLGRDASLFTGFVRLAMKYDTPLVFGVAIRNKDDSYRFVFEKPIIPSAFKQSRNILDNRELELQIAKHYHERLEHYIKLHPEQWFWLHRRWKGAHKAKETTL